MAIFRIVDPIYIPVRDLEKSTRWYGEKLDCHEMKGIKNEPGTIIFQTDPEEGTLIIGLPDDKNPASFEASPAVPTLFTDHIEKAHSLLNSRGVAPGAVQRDRQGTRYFEIRDLDGNLLEISEEP